MRSESHQRNQNEIQSLYLHSYIIEMRYIQVPFYIIIHFVQYLVKTTVI